MCKSIPKSLMRYPRKSKKNHTYSLNTEHRDPYYSIDLLFTAHINHHFPYFAHAFHSFNSPSAVFNTNATHAHIAYRIWFIHSFSCVCAVCVCARSNHYCFIRVCISNTHSHASTYLCRLMGAKTEENARIHTCI